MLRSDPEAYAEQVVALVNAESHRSPDPGSLLPFRRYSTSDLPSILALTGERGAGKTTALNLACEALDANKFLVVPVIQPELFTPVQSLVGMTFANLLAYFREWDPKVLEVQSPSSGFTIGAVLERALRRASARAVPEIRTSGDLDSWASEFSRSADIEASFIDEWRNIVESIRLAVARIHRSRQKVEIVIPVDDPDLAPHCLPDLLLDMRSLASVENIIVLACLDLDETEAILADRYRSGFHSNQPGISAYSVVSGQITKAVPPRLRVQIAELDTVQRLEFRPIESTTPLASADDRNLAELLGTFGLGDAFAGTPTFRDLFGLGGLATRPTIYAEALSSNPRELSTLYGGLQRISEERYTDQRERSKAAAIMLLEHALRYGYRRSETLPLDPAGLVTITRAGESTVVEPHFAQLHYAGDSGAVRYMRQVETPVGQVEIRGGSSQRLKCTVRPPGKDEDGLRKVPTSGPAVHPGAFMAPLLAYEFGRIYDLFDTRLDGMPPIVGGEVDRPFLTVYVGEAEADSRFMLLPAWEGYFDYSLYYLGWDHLLEAIAGAEAISHLGPVLLVLGSWHAIASVQADRIEPQSVKAAVEPFARLRSPGSQLRRLHEVAESVMNQVCDVYVKSLGFKSQRDMDYVAWFESLLLHSLFPGIVDGSVAKYVLARWSDAVEASGREFAASREFFAVLNRRVRKSVDEDWVGALIDLGEALGWPDVEEARALAVRGQELRRSQRDRRLGNAAAGQLLPVTSPEDAEAGALSEALSRLASLEQEAMAARSGSDPQRQMS